VIDLICWDFGDTLVDERWMRTPHPTYADWAAHYGEVLAADPAWVQAWDEGRASVGELVERLQRRTGLPAGSIEDHIADACRGVRFFPAPRVALDVLRGQVLQACTTVNPDVFTTYVVPALGLDALFDVVVTSWETGMTAKSALARRARRQLGLGDDLATTLLVDNKAANVEEFRAAGGVAYLFTGEDAFAADFHAGLPGLVAAAGGSTSSSSSPSRP
jgi:FMN phosphatase YigB (HAD superfamily)